MTSKLTTEINALKEQLSNLSPEGKSTFTIRADNTGELMDSCISVNCNLIKPFEDSTNQDYYYFLVNVKPNVIIRVIGTPKIYRK